jgi:hypothetical protein
MPKQNNPKAERQQRNTEKAISVVSNNKIKVTQAEEKCTCVKHPEPTHWSICPFRVLCSEGAPYTAFLSGVSFFLFPVPVIVES